MSPESSAVTPWHRRRPIRWLVAAVIVLLLYAITGFWIAPGVIASQLRKRLPSLTHREAAVGTVEVNPFTLTLTISNLSLTEPGGGSFVSWERFHADMEVASIWRWTLVLSEVELVRPILELERRTNGTFNFANLIPAASAEPSSNAPLPALEIQSLRVQGGRVALRDHAIPGGFEEILGPVELSFTNFNTLHPEGAVGQLRVATRTGEAIRWDGDLALAPPASSGVLNVGPVAIPRHGPYLNLATPANVLSGTFDMEVHYQLRWTPSGPDLVISNTSLNLEALAVRVPGASDTNFVLKTLTVSDVSAGLLDKRLRVGKVHALDGSFAAQRGSDGAVDVAKSIRPEFIEKTVQALQDQLAGWNIELPELLGDRLELRWGDVTPESPVRLSALVDHIQVQGLSNQTNRPVTVNGEATWGETGRMKLIAEATLIPATATARVEFANMRLPYLQPYVGQFLNLNVREGTVDGRWTANYNRNLGGPLITLEGGLEVNHFLAFDTQAGRDFLKWESVQVRDVQGSYEPAAVKIREIHLQAPSSSLVLMTNGQINVLALLRTNAAEVVVAPLAPVASASFPLSVSLDRLSFTNAALVAADDTVPGQFSTSLQRFSGSVTDLAWPELKKSRVEIAGYVGTRAPFAVDGWVIPDPKRPFLDMHVTTANAELIPFTPYVIKFAGYSLKEGRVTADVRYKVDGRQVQGENHVVVDRLTLGAKAPGKPLLDLPIRLGIALLKDSDGRITLDVPVRGSLDDPEFGIGKVVWQAVKGIFVKVATAPFKLLGSLFGGSEDDGQQLQTVEFAAGQTHLAPAATNRLARLVTALNKRPELLVSVRAGASPVEDAPALARLKLKESLLTLQTNSLAPGETVPATLDTNRFLAQLFTNTFPAVNLTNSASAVTDPGAAVATPLLTVDQMEQQLLKQMEPSVQEMSALRTGRLEVVKAWLVSAQRLPAERVVEPDPSDTNAPPLLDRVVEFSLE